MSIDDIFTALPTLETARLILWEISPEEQAAFTRRLPPSERTWYPPETVNSPFSVTIGQLGIHTLPAWGIMHKENDELIGCCSFRQWHLRHSRAGLCFAMIPGYRRRGYITETLKSVISFGFRIMELNRIEALCDPANLAALRVLRKLGMQEEATLRQYRLEQGVRCHRKLFSIIRQEWAPR